MLDPSAIHPSWVHRIRSPRSTPEPARGARSGEKIAEMALKTLVTGLPPSSTATAVSAAPPVTSGWNCS